MLYTVVWYGNAKPAKSSGVTQSTHLSIDEKTVQQFKQQQQQTRKSLKKESYILNIKIFAISVSSFSSFLVSYLYIILSFFVSVLLSTFLSDFFLYSVWTISYMPMHTYIHVRSFIIQLYMYQQQQQQQQLRRKKLSNKYALYF